MDCQEVQSLLSAYHDDELADDVRPAVAEHLGDCPRCSEELAVFQCMSGTSKQLADPAPPEEIWTGIEEALGDDLTNAPGARPASQRGRRTRKWRTRYFVTAALVLVAVGVVWIATSWHPPGHHRELAADFNRYLEHFAASPEAAQNILLAKYEGKPLDAAGAESLVGYRPAVADGLPEGYSLDAMYVLEMPCCTCVQAVCRREDGRVFAIFEHSQDQEVWYGDRPVVQTECKGRSCSLTEADSTLLATWKSKQRQLTIVGVEDLEEVGDLMTHFDAVSSGA